MGSCLSQKPTSRPDTPYPLKHEVEKSTEPKKAVVKAVAKPSVKKDRLLDSLRESLIQGGWTRIGAYVHKVEFIELGLEEGRLDSKVWKDFVILVYYN